MRTSPPKLNPAISLSTTMEFFNSKPVLRRDLSKRQNAIIDGLLREALASGVVTGHDIKGYSIPAGEGSETELVALTAADIRYAVKIDVNEKLVREALKLRSIANRRELPKGFSGHFPKVYAIKSDKPPYAYIMQAFDRESYAEYLFKSKNTEEDARRVMEVILAVLMPAYGATVNYNLMPSMKGLYIDRIYDRLEIARNISPDFRKISTRPVIINGQKFETPETYLHKIEKHLNQFAVNFTTFVHGDCHLENILIKFHPEGLIDLKFIDTKDWHEGDYMFDIGKMVHYLTVTGPAQKTHKPAKPKINFDKGTIHYNLSLETFHIPGLREMIFKRLHKFAAKTKDTNWEKRFTLSMAANLLGLPAGRLKSTDPRKVNAAYMLYAEGLMYLAKGCDFVAELSASLKIEPVKS